MKIWKFRLHNRIPRAKISVNSNCRVFIQFSRIIINISPILGYFWAILGYFRTQKWDLKTLHMTIYICLSLDSSVSVQNIFQICHIILHLVSFRTLVLVPWKLPILGSLWVLSILAQKTQNWKKKKILFSKLQLIGLSFAKKLHLKILKCMEDIQNWKSVSTLFLRGFRVSCPYSFRSPCSH